jgi:hypothetical protein
MRYSIAFSDGSFPKRAATLQSAKTAATQAFNASSGADMTATLWRCERGIYILEWQRCYPDGKWQRA